ncbi:MAG: universal stress protein, partial [Gorillibacterium sp.]|nr:universal stress protein [Gorillibacterium sp.]
MKTGIMDVIRHIHTIYANESGGTNLKRNIIVPFDGSDSAQEALKAAIEMAKKYEESIVLINVQSSFTTPH